MTHRIVTFLAKEITWGRLALMALVCALLVMIVLPFSGNLVSMVPLLILSIGGILVERSAPEHPYLNSLVFAILGILFTLLMNILSFMGAVQRLPTLLEMSGLIYLFIFIPQALLGTWIGVTIRRVREMREAAKKEGEKPAGKKQRPSSRKRRGQ